MLMIGGRGCSFSNDPPSAARAYGNGVLGGTGTHFMNEPGQDLCSNRVAKDQKNGTDTYGDTVLKLQLCHQNTADVSTYICTLDKP